MQPSYDRPFSEVQVRFTAWQGQQITEDDPDALPLPVLNAMAGIMLQYGEATASYVYPDSPLFKAFARLARAAYQEGVCDGNR